jgi:hypothetical protein
MPCDRPGRRAPGAPRSGPHEPSRCSPGRSHRPRLPEYRPGEVLGQARRGADPARRRIALADPGRPAHHDDGGGRRGVRPGRPHSQRRAGVGVGHRSHQPIPGRGPRSGRGPSRGGRHLPQRCPDRGRDGLLGVRFRGPGTGRGDCLRTGPRPAGAEPAGPARIGIGLPLGGPGAGDLARRRRSRLLRRTGARPRSAAGAGDRLAASQGGLQPPGDAAQPRHLPLLSPPG